MAKNYCKFYLTFPNFSGGIIALGVFGGFVFLAAVITTIVILIRRCAHARMPLHIFYIA